MVFTSLDQLAREVRDRRLVRVGLHDLLGAVGRKRLTAAALLALNDALEERLLEIIPAISARVKEYRVLRRDSAVALLFEAAAEQSLEADAVLAAYGTPPSTDGAIVRNLAELLMWHGVDTLEDLSVNYADNVDPDLWITFPNEDQYTQWPDPDRVSGVTVRTLDAHFYLAYPFDPQRLSNDVETLDELYLFKVELNDWCPGAEYDVYLNSLVEDRWIRPYVELSDNFETTKLGFVDDEHEGAPLVAVYQRRSTVRFNLRPADVPLMMERDDVWATSDHPTRARVICRADDETLVYELVLASIVHGQLADTGSG